MKGICFIEPLTIATIKGTKVQIRRLVTPQPTYSESVGVIWKDRCYGIGLHNNPKEAYKNFADSAKAPFNVGDKLYIKEPYRFAPDVDFPIYKYDYPSGRYSYPGCDRDDRPVKWKNKLFMPASSARYFIEITAKRFERLQDISDADCIKEGIAEVTKDGETFKFGLPDKDGLPYGIGWAWTEWCKTPREAYAKLIDQTCGKGTWESNPYVWVYDYKLVK